MEKLHELKINVVYIDVNKINPNPYQPRKYFDEKLLKELCISVQKYGLIEPIVVRNLKGDIYEMISGERRLKAYKKLGLDKIECIINNMGEKDSAYISLIENIQRKNLNIIEEAQAYQSMMVYFGYSKEDMANIIGKNEKEIENKLKILTLNKDIKQIILDSNLSLEHAVLIADIKDDIMKEEILQKTINLGLNIVNTKRLIQKCISNVKYPKRKIKGYLSDINLFTNTIKDAVSDMQNLGVNTMYTINKNENGYEIKIKVCT